MGAGGWGEVYRARETHLGRDVAVKVLPAHLASDPELKQRMERETRAISSLNHPHICTLHDIGSLPATSSTSVFLTACFRPSESERDYGPCNVSANGKKFLLHSRNLKESSDPSTLVLYWPAELKR